MDAAADRAPDLSFDQLMELDRRAAAREHAAEGDDDTTEQRPGGAAGDDVIVLPWWQHPINIVTMVVTAAILAAMIGWMVGDNGSRIAHNDVDTGFLQDMREHHEQAVLMGVIYRNLPDTDPGLRTIARSIVIGQSIEVGRMIQLLRNFGESEINESETSMVWMGMVAEPGQMPGMASEAELDELGRLSGPEADELFVELMTDHHLGGIEMAEFAIANADAEEVKLMASSMAGAQAGEITEMVNQLG
jgi:uncharacterized protein (DUF305 family)